jgi:hypothetical protein
MSDARTTAVMQLKAKSGPMTRANMRVLICTSCDGLTAVPPSAIGHPKL